MIKFFRKIRYDLMEKNKTGKYFKYAIGEIILVVIGILIALQINNWNEERKERSDTIALLQNTQISVKEDIAQLRFQIALLEKLSKNTYLALKVIENEETLNAKDQMILDSALINLGRMGVNASNLSMLEELSFNKFLSLHHNSLVVELNQIIDRIEETKNLQGYFQEAILDRERMNNLNVLRFSSDRHPIYKYQVLKDDHMIFETLLNSISFQYGLVKRYTDIVNRCLALNAHISEIIVKIDNE